LFVRDRLGLAPDITERHVQVMAKLMLTSSLCMSYAYVFDAFEPFYLGDDTARVQFLNRLFGTGAVVYWGMIFFNCLFPLVLCFARIRANHTILALVAWGSIAGMWLERYNIVTVSLQRTHLPSAWGGYFPTFWDWAVFGGTVGLFFCGILAAVRLVPIVSMYEMRELLVRRGQT
jgi:molybdopterin-containing oxidoreductase family membrane subunit